MADADRLAAALRYQQDQAMPSPLAAAIQSPEYIGGALRDPQFYGDIGRRLSGLLKGGLQDILPTGAGPIMAKQGYEADPNYMQKMNDVGLAGMTVFHGSPYKFDKFDMSKIGTGEGAQAYGHGLYLAENPGVAKEYAKNLSENRLFDAKNAPFDVQTNLSNPNVRAVLHKTNGDIDAAIARARQAIEAIPGTQGAEYAAKDIRTLTALKSAGGLQKQGGSLYKVDLPDEQIAKMLDWDKPLSQQAPEVQKAIKDAGLIKNDGTLSFMYNGEARTGGELYERLTSPLAKKFTQGDGGNAASKYLNSIGIPGIRYLDAGSRTGKAGTSNFVVFDDALPKIIGRE
jgi:hypothetical protein